MFKKPFKIKHNTQLKGSSRLHLLAACPEGKTLELKKTKYKKLSSFLEEMESLQLIKLETVSKGVLVISSINNDHEYLKTFSKTYSHIAEEDKKPSENEQATTTLRVEEKYCVNASTLPLFSLYLYKKQDVITKESVRNCIRDYVEKQNLADSKDKRMIVLDGVLKKIVGGGESSVNWAQLNEAVIKKLGDCYSVHTADRSTALVKGKLSPIDIQVGTRSCNKKVTLVNNLELYGINMKEFCQECQHGVAASTTINHPPSLKGAQVQVQGNQVAFVSKLLMEKYNIPKRMIRGMENIPKKKK
ncbi:eukaryotic translation initiation factor 2D isoform X2 [Nilaparvata lugens]|uniref:eukaryotic translation initiation factor 2D isoform X2 n=1 Tax=Nilaparvata lugens TaxID=108931 RepID=UPI000B9962EE|nr:eukaryotic translation initiation factor 2D isoform X2 [Nilaparvata lugens]